VLSGTVSDQLQHKLVALAKRLGVPPEVFVPAWAPLLDLADRHGNHPDAFSDALNEECELFPHKAKTYQQAWLATKPRVAQSGAAPTAAFGAYLDEITAPYGIAVNWPAALHYLDNLTVPKARPGRPVGSGTKYFSSRENFLARVAVAGGELHDKGQPPTQTAIGAILLDPHTADPGRGMRGWMVRFKFNSWADVLNKAGLS
jgi:hypothetical protein